MGQLDPLTDMKVDLAVLQERYDQIVTRLDEGKATMQGLNEKFDTVIRGMHEAAQDRALDAQRRKWKAAVWTGTRHILTLAGAVIVAKMLKEPLNIGL